MLGLLSLTGMACVLKPYGRNGLEQIISCASLRGMMCFKVVRAQEFKADNIMYRGVEALQMKHLSGTGTGYLRNKLYHLKIEAEFKKFWVRGNQKYRYSSCSSACKGYWCVSFKSLIRVLSPKKKEQRIFTKRKKKLVLVASTRKVRV